MTEMKKPLLIEIGLEELPARFMTSMLKSFETNLIANLKNLRLSHGEIEQFATPRRLALLVHDLDTEQASIEVEQKGPPLTHALDEAGNPTRAGLGCAKKCGVEFAELEKIETNGGSYLLHRKTDAGQPTNALLINTLKQVVEKIDAPRPMRWPQSQQEFIRPVRSLCCLFGSETIAFEAFGVTATNEVEGHRVLSPGFHAIMHAQEYENQLESNCKITPSDSKRLQTIQSQAEKIAQGIGQKLSCSKDLLIEIAALTESPYSVLGQFDEAFLKLPKAVIQLTLEQHQKVIPLESSNGDLYPGFIAVTNLPGAADENLIKGNERVIKPRLADAAFFYDQDLKVPLENYYEKLTKTQFHKKLGTVADKVERVVAITKTLCEQLTAPLWANEGLDADALIRSAKLCKNDLATQVVYEIPELQGYMGGKYAAHSNEASLVADAIASHYQPAFAEDDLPSSINAKLLALIDKLDTVVSLFAAGEKPTGSADPYGLRRQALGIVKILAALPDDLCLGKLISMALDVLGDSLQNIEGLNNSKQTLQNDILTFFVGRIHNYFETSSDTPIKPQWIDAVLAAKPTGMLDLQKRLQALTTILKSSHFDVLSQTNKRCRNILSKASAGDVANEVDESLFESDAESHLLSATQSCEINVNSAIEAKTFDKALDAMTELSLPMTHFFEEVMVNAEDRRIKANRLALLKRLDRLLSSVVDLSMIAKSKS